MACLGLSTTSATSWPAVALGRKYANWITTESSETVTCVALLNAGLASGGIVIAIGFLCGAIREICYAIK